MRPLVATGLLIFFSRIPSDILIYTDADKYTSTHAKTYLPNSPKVQCNAIVQGKTLYINREAYENYTGDLNHWKGIKNTCQPSIFNFRHICLHIVCCMDYIADKSPWKTVANCSHKRLFTVALVLYNPFAA